MSLYAHVACCSSVLPHPHSRIPRTAVPLWDTAQKERHSGLNQTLALCLAQK